MSNRLTDQEIARWLEKAPDRVEKGGHYIHASDIARQLHEEVTTLRARMTELTQSHARLEKVARDCKQQYHNRRDAMLEMADRISVLEKVRAHYADGANWTNQNPTYGAPFTLYTGGDGPAVAGEAAND